MCVCTPGIKTPYCGKPGCTWPFSPDEPTTQGNKMQPVKLGNIVEDEVTGFCGTATAILEPATGMNQICIQPRGEGTVIPEAMFIDEYSVKFVDEGLANRLPIPAVPKFIFGQEVRDVISDQIGIVTSKITYMNGCVHFAVTPKSQENKSPDVFFIDQNRLEPVSSGVQEKLAGAKKSDSPGGPMTRASMVKAR